MIAAGTDSDQDDEIEELFGQETVKNQTEHLDFTKQATFALQQQNTILKKKRTYYYYSLDFDVEFDYDDDTVYFAFS